MILSPKETIERNKERENWKAVYRQRDAFPDWNAEVAKRNSWIQRQRKLVSLAEATLWRSECEALANATVIGHKWTLNAVDISLVDIYARSVRDERALIKELSGAE